MVHFGKRGAVEDVEGMRVEEGLDRGAHLASSLYGTVEAAFLIGAATDQGQYAPIRIINSDECSLKVIGGREEFFFNSK
jgi:hypothetical protein